ncbi:MAG: sodium/solute symporter [Acidobacteriota bacterium]
MTGASYDRGFVAITAEWAAILIGLNALLWIFLPFYLKNGFYTMPECAHRRYGAVARTAYRGLIILIYIFIEISAVLYLGALALHSLLGFPMLASIILLAAMTAVYTITGGLRAVVWTEMLQLGVLLLGGGILSAVTINAAGGWSQVLATSHEWDLWLPVSDPDYPWTQYLGGVLCVSTFYWATNQFIVQRALASRSEKHAHLGVVMAQYVKFLLPLLTVVPGLMAARLFPNLEKPDLAFPTLVQNLLPPGLIGLVLAGLIAAIMSHVSGAVNSCTTIASVDFYDTSRISARKRPTPRWCASASGWEWRWCCPASSGRP